MCYGFFENLIIWFREFFLDFSTLFVFVREKVGSRGENYKDVYFMKCINQDSNLLNMKFFFMDD